MRLAAVFVALSVVAGAAAPAAADIYVWRDGAGVSHYTNDLANVPPDYRGNAITVAREWVRAEPPPEEREEVAGGSAEPAVATSVAVPEGEVPGRDVYDAGFAAGVRAAESGGAPSAVASSASVGPVFQMMGEESAPRDRLIFGGPIVVQRPRHQTPKDSKDEERRRRFPRATTAPFLQGPAGPPPVSFSRQSPP